MLNAGLYRWILLGLVCSVMCQVYVPTCASKCADNIMRTTSCDSDPTCMCLDLVHQMLPDCACYACSSADIQAVNDAVQVMCPDNWTTNVTCPNLQGTSRSSTVSSTTLSSATSSPAPASTSSPVSSTKDTEGTNSTTKIAIGIAVPVGAILILLGGWLAYRRGKKSAQATAVPIQQDSPDNYTPGRAELTGLGKHAYESETGSLEKHSFISSPTVTELSGPNAKTDAGNGPRYSEMNTQNNSHELRGNYVQTARYAEMTTQNNSHEASTLQGNSHELSGNQIRGNSISELPAHRYE